MRQRGREGGRTQHTLAEFTVSVLTKGPQLALFRNKHGEVESADHVLHLYVLLRSLIADQRTGNALKLAVVAKENSALVIVSELACH